MGKAWDYYLRIYKQGGSERRLREARNLALDEMQVEAHTRSTAYGDKLRTDKLMKKLDEPEEGYRSWVAYGD